VLRRSEDAGGVPESIRLRFSRYFGTSRGFWLRLQLDYDLMRAERKNGERIQREVQPHAA